MDHATSRDVLYGFAGDHYKAAVLAVVGPDATPELRYGGFMGQPAVPNGTHWARVARQVVSEGQETLRLDVRRFQSTGLVFVQFFVPTDDPQGLRHLDEIAESVRNAFRSYQHEELEFTNATINDNVAPEPNWLRANVSARYQYRQFVS